jgi:5-formyltetrahydrofolate cyclo-ligase
MEEAQLTKDGIRDLISRRVAEMPAETRQDNLDRIEQRLAEFANYIESRIVLFYVEKEGEVPTKGIIEHSLDHNKIVVLPAFKTNNHSMKLFKVGHPVKDLIMGGRGILEPNPTRCKAVPVDVIDIAIIPGLVFDEKGGRIGSGQGYYDRLIPKLTLTTRKVAITMEAQLLPIVPMESHDRYVDIIISEKRVIYKI